MLFQGRHVATDSSQNTFHVEMLSIDQFAAKMGVSRTTVYEWFKSGYLSPGRHYIKIGKTTLFAWGAELLQKLHEDSCDRVSEDVKSQNETVLDMRGSQVSRVPSARKKGIQVNLDY